MKEEFRKGSLPLSSEYPLIPLMKRFRVRGNLHGLRSAQSAEYSEYRPALSCKAESEERIISMNNKEIIAQKQLELVLDGRLGVIRDENDVPAPEPLMTYKQWRKLGYAVNKGEKAAADIEIWQPVIKLRKTAFFSLSQVTKIKAEEE